MSWIWPEEEATIRDCPICKDKKPTKDCPLCFGTGWAYVWDIEAYQSSAPSKDPSCSDSMKSHLLSKR